MGKRDNFCHLFSAAQHRRWWNPFISWTRPRSGDGSCLVYLSVSDESEVVGLLFQWGFWGVRDALRTQSAVVFSGEEWRGSNAEEVRELLEGTFQKAYCPQRKL